MDLHALRTRFSLGVMLAFAFATSAAAVNLRCGTRVVAPGMLDGQVRNACGAPFWIDAFNTVEVLGAGGPIEEQREIDWEIWYFNFGPTRLMQRLSFRDGELQQIDALGYGVAEIGSACGPPLAARGLTAGELVARCGEPASRRRGEGAIVRRAPGLIVARERRREDWLYDDGSDLLTLYRITDGVVSDVERLRR